MHLWVELGRFLDGVLDRLVVVHRLSVALDRDLLLHPRLADAVLLHFVLIEERVEKKEV